MAEQYVSGRTAPGRVKQSSTRQDQARPGRPGQADKRSFSVEQGWTRPNRAWRGQQNWTGAAGRAVLDSTQPVRIGLGQDRANWVRIGRGRLGQERA